MMIQVDTIGPIILGYNTPAYKNRHITIYKFLQHTHFKVPPPTLYFNYNTYMYLLGADELQNELPQMPINSPQHTQCYCIN